MEWDTAAMDIIVTEAGAFSGIDGKDFIYNKKNPENPTALCLNRKKRTQIS